MFRYREYFESKELGGNYSKGSGKLVEMLFNKKNYLLRFTEASEIHLQIGLSIIIYNIKKYIKIYFVFRIVSHTNRNLNVIILLLRTITDLQMYRYMKVTIQRDREGINRLIVIKLV